MGTVGQLSLDFVLLLLLEAQYGFETDICASLMTPHTLPSCSGCLNAGTA